MMDDGRGKRDEELGMVALAIVNEELR